MTTVQLTNVSVQVDRCTLLRDATHTFRPGTWSAVIGRNGAGKSTLLRAMLGSVPVSGSVTFDGRPLGELDREERLRTVAYAPQSAPAPTEISVRTFVALGQGPPKGMLGRCDDRSDAVDSALSHLDLVHRASHTMGSLSGGERQRAVLAQCMVQAASVLLLDEPTTALDLGHQQEVLGHVERLRRRTGLTIISVLHDLTLAARYAQELVLLDEGVIVRSGTADEVLTPRNLLDHLHVRAVLLHTDEGPIVSLRRDRVVEGPGG